MLYGRAPQGARGLKCYELELKYTSRVSRPARGAWVEIIIIMVLGMFGVVAPRKGRVG